MSAPGSCGRGAGGWAKIRHHRQPGLVRQMKATGHDGGGYDSVQHNADDSGDDSVNESANDRLTRRRLRVEHASVVMRAVVNAVIAAVVGVVLNAVIAAAIMAGGFHLPDKTRLAMVTYFRPASCAAATASGSGHSSRTLASFTSIGRLIPARTSTLGRLMTEIARFDGVPPNMSVRMATPSPLSTRRTASIMSMRRSSTSSSGPMVTASI